MKILITEDEPILADELETMVAELGHQVIGVAATFKDVVKIAERTSCDLALVDVHLKDGITGPDIARHLADACHTIVIFTTSNPGRIPDDFATACGVLAKPLSEQTLKSAIAFVGECLIEGCAKHNKPAALNLSPAYAQRWKVS